MYVDFPDWLSQEAIATLNKGYLLKKGDYYADGSLVIDDETPKDAYQRVADRVYDYYPELGQEVRDDLFHCLYSGWIGLATPVFSNFGAERGMPISCFLVHVGDSIESIYKKKLTVAQMSKNGGGTAVYFGDIRPEGSTIKGGGVSSNIRHWVKGYDHLASVVNQGGVRRGSVAAYIPIEHPDINEILLSKDHGQGDPRNFLDCNIAVTITDAFMEGIKNGDKEKRELFEKILETRLITGSPYIIYIDTVNKNLPPGYNELGLKVSMSNLCSEILLHTDPNHSAVCCLSSMNLSKWDEYSRWVGKSGYTAVQLGIILLDAVLQEFINKATGVDGLECAVAFAEKSRSLGLGTLGLFSYFQSHMIDPEDQIAIDVSNSIHRTIYTQADEVSEKLGKILGIPEWCKYAGRRNSTLIAIAPTRTNASITGSYSQGIEPPESNYYIAKQNKRSFIRKNPYIVKLLDNRVADETEREKIWDSILSHLGSISHLDIFTDHEKKVFKTAREIDQKALIRLAAGRQPYICQSQSLNLFVPADITGKELWEIHVLAWKLGVKSLYYLKGKSLIVDRKSIDDPEYTIITKDGCPYCVKLKSQLVAEGKNFKEVSLEEAKLQEVWDDGWKTVPQLFHFGERIGGYDDYMGIDNLGECVSCEG